MIVTDIEPSDPPFQIAQNCVTPRNDLMNSQEEADVIIIHQLMHVVETSNQSPISIISDDTDVFILLFYFYKVKCIDVDVFLETTSKERRLIDIGNTVEQLENQGYSIEDILPLHALTGCDTVSALLNVGKLKLLSVLKKNCDLHLSFLGENSNQFDDVYK